MGGCGEQREGVSDSLASSGQLGSGISCFVLDKPQGVT